MKKFLLSISAISFTALASPASAAPLQFIFVHENPTQTFYFSLDSNPVPEAVLPGQFAFFSVPVNSFLGTTVTQVDFFSSGGFNVGDVNNFVSFHNGPVLFSGPVSNPTFLKGAFNLSGTGGSGVLFIENNLAAVPEPATWAFLIFGFAAVGGLMRMKRAKKVTVSYR